MTRDKNNKAFHDHTRSSARLVVAIGLSALIVYGCRSGEHKTATDSVPGIVRTAKGDGVTLTLSATPDELDVSERTVVQVEVVAENGVTVSVDSYENALHESEHRFDFRLIAARKEEAIPQKNGSLRWRYTFDLEFVLPETYELPAASLSYVDTRTPTESVASAPRGRREEPRRFRALRPPRGAAATASKAQSLETETLPIVVREPADRQLSPEEMMKVTTLSPVELPINWLEWWWVLPIAAVTLFAMVLLLRRRRSVRSSVTMIIPAHEWARRELATLAAEGLIEHGRMQLYHYRISDIVRGYIERRFDLAAPEMTTEEFLATTAGDRRFGADVSEELQQFLEACDIVKYARVEPGPDEPNRLMQSAIGFVDRTQERPVVANTQQYIVEHAA